MSQLQVNLFEKVFDNKQVRILTDVNNEIWFVGLDIDKILEYKDPKKAIANNVDNEDKIPFDKFKQSNAGKNFPSLLNKVIDDQTRIINESGFYSLVLRSKKDNSSRFRRWVTCEVLSSIRKTGKYEIEKSQKAIELEHMKVQLDTYKL